MNIVNALVSPVVALVAIIGLIVLTALHDVPSAVAVPSIIGLTGIHVVSVSAGVTTGGASTAQGVPPVDKSATGL